MPTLRSSALPLEVTEDPPVVEGLTTGADAGGEEVIQRIAGRWQVLCDETRCPPFLRPEWITAYLRVFEPASKVLLLTAALGNRLVAVLPLVLRRCWWAGVPLMKLAGAANVHSVRFDILSTQCPAGKAAIPALWSLLKQLPIWQILELPMFPAGGPCQELTRCASRDGYRTAIFPHEGGPILRMRQDDRGQLTWLDGTSRHFRHELRRFRRLLEAELGGEPKLICHTHPDRETLARFYQLEAAGWKGKASSAIDCASETRAFYDEIAQQAAAQGYFCLHSLEWDGAMAAASFGVFSHDCYFPMKIAYDETRHRGAPGHLLFNAILQQCAEQRIPQLFFGGAMDRFKTSWTSERLPHFTGFVFAPDFRAQLAYQLKAHVLSPVARFARQVIAR